MYKLEWSKGGIMGSHINIKRNGKWVGHLYLDCEDKETEEKLLREKLENQEKTP